jgi:hypothetical protein
VYVMLTTMQMQVHVLHVQMDVKLAHLPLLVDHVLMEKVPEILLVMGVYAWLVTMMMVPVQFVLSVV